MDTNNDDQPTLDYASPKRRSRWEKAWTVMFYFLLATLAVVLVGFSSFCVFSWAGGYLDR